MHGVKMQSKKKIIAIKVKVYLDDVHVFFLCLETDRDRDDHFVRILVADRVPFDLILIP